MQKYIFLIIGIVFLILLLLINKNKFGSPKFVFWKSIIAIIVFTAILVWSIIYKSFNGNIIIFLLLYLIIITYLMIRLIKNYKLMGK